MVSNVELIETEHGCIACGVVRINEPIDWQQSDWFVRGIYRGSIDLDYSCLSYILLQQVFLRYPDLVPLVNWLRVVIPTDCEHCLHRRNVTFFISLDGRTCCSLPEGAVFEEWF